MSKKKPSKLITLIKSFFSALALFAFYKYTSGKSANMPNTPNTPNTLSEYHKWRDVIFSVTSDQVGVSGDKANQVYGVVMDVGLSDNFIISITAFPTGESSLRTTIGGGTIGLGGDEIIAKLAQQIVTSAQSLAEKATQTNDHNLPKSQVVYFYFLTTSGLMLRETSVKEAYAHNHPLHEIFIQFTKIKTRSEELKEKYKG